MTENNPINIETRRPLSDEQLAEMKRLIAETEKQKAAREFSDFQEKVPQKQERAFQAHLDSKLAEHVEQIAVPAKPTVETHEEAGMKLPSHIQTVEEQRKYASDLINAPSAKIKEPGGANDLQHQMEDLVNKAA